MGEEQIPTESTTLPEAGTGKRGRGRPKGSKDLKPRFRARPEKLAIEKAVKKLPQKAIVPVRKLKDATVLLPVVQNLASAGCTAGEIGIILGAGAGDKQAARVLAKLRSDSPAFDLAWKNGVRAADVQLVGKMYETAMGYQYDETTLEEIPVQGEMVVKRKVVRKYEKPSIEALMFLIQNRMKEEFRNTQHIDVNKKSVDITAELTTKQMADISGKLMEHLIENRKRIESVAKNVESCDKTCDPGTVPPGDPSGQTGESGMAEDPARISGEGQSSPDVVPGLLP